MLSSKSTPSLASAFVNCTTSGSNVSRLEEAEFFEDAVGGGKYFWEVGDVGGGREEEGEVLFERDIVVRCEGGEEKLRLV